MASTPSRLSRCTGVNWVRRGKVILKPSRAEELCRPIVAATAMIANDLINVPGIVLSSPSSNNAHRGRSLWAHGFGCEEFKRVAFQNGIGRARERAFDNL